MSLVKFDLDVIAQWRERGEIPFDRSTVEFAYTLIDKLLDELDVWKRIADDLSQVPPASPQAGRPQGVEPTGDAPASPVGESPASTASADPAALAGNTTEEGRGE